MRSNVIYINKTRRADDPEFVGHIRDHAVLKRYSPRPGFYTAPLSKLQQEILARGEPKCSKEKGTMSWGVPTGAEHMELRCEERGCPRYPQCVRDPCFHLICRSTPDPYAAGETAQAPCTVEDTEPAEVTAAEAAPEGSLSENAASETPEGPPEVRSAETSETGPEEAHPQIPVLTQEEIIHADLDSRIWVNAGPGTGKTYTVIQRLKTIFQEEDPDGTVLVLCYSRNAVGVIRSRLREELGQALDELIEDERLIVRTFDSYATWTLDDDLRPGLQYDQRIALFLQKLPEDPQVLENVCYLIVDEVQDIVGIRARMVQAMISRMDGGVLLLGDRCQAIYDWSVREQGDLISEDLLRWIKDQEFRTVELTGDHRQTKELTRMGDRMRRRILQGTVEEQERVLEECKKTLETIPEAELAERLTGESDLILCKTNGLVASISDLLYEGTPYVPHTVMQSARRQSLAPWIGRILGGCTEAQISRGHGPGGRARRGGRGREVGSAQSAGYPHPFRCAPPE